MMDNTYPNSEFIRRTANFREELEAFMKTADDEGNPNPDYTFEDQNKLYETMMNKAYDLALFVESYEAEGYRLVKAEADPVEATTPDLSPVDDDKWLQDVLSDEGVQTRIPTVKDLAEMFDLEYDEEDEEFPAWLIDEDSDDEDGSENKSLLVRLTPSGPEFGFSGFPLGACPQCGQPLGENDQDEGICVGCFISNEREWAGYTND